MCVPVTTTLTIEERAKRSGLVAVLDQKSRPKVTLSIIVKISIDPLIQENFCVGMGIYHGPMAGQEVWLEGKAFRSFEFQEVNSTLDEEEIPEAYKTQARHFLLSPGADAEL